MTTELEDIDKQLRDLRMKQMRIGLKNFKDHVKPMVKTAIGKAFVYRNNSTGNGEKFRRCKNLLSA